MVSSVLFNKKEDQRVLSVKLSISCLVRPSNYQQYLSSTMCSSDSMEYRNKIKYIRLVPNLDGEVMPFKACLYGT